MSPWPPMSPVWRDEYKRKAAEPGTVVWIFGQAPDGLAAQVRATGATVVDDPLDPLVDLVRVHKVALARAALLGLDPDQPRNLTRSVVLGQSAF